MKHDDRYDVLVTCVTIALLLVLIILFAATGHAKTRPAFYINAQSIDGIRVIQCGPMVNRVRECKALFHFKDDSVSSKPTKAELSISEVQ